MNQKNYLLISFFTPTKLKTAFEELVSLLLKFLKFS